jgi:hypothetical protein
VEGAVLRRAHDVLAFILFATFIAHFSAALMHSFMFRDGFSAEEFCVRSQYPIAPGGGKTVGPLLGINMVGPTRLWDYVAAR